MRRCRGKYNQVLIDFTGNRTAVINLNEKHRTPQAAVCDDDGGDAVYGSGSGGDFSAFYRGDYGAF